MVAQYSELMQALSHQPDAVQTQPLSSEKVCFMACVAPAGHPATTSHKDIATRV